MRSWKPRTRSRKESEQDEDINVEAQLTQRGKPRHTALVRALHPDEDDETGRAVSKCGARGRPNLLPLGGG